MSATLIHAAQGLTGLVAIAIFILLINDFVERKR
jgi:hypothetical protein